MLFAARGAWNRRMAEVLVGNSPHGGILPPSCQHMNGGCCSRQASEPLLFGFIAVGSFILNNKTPRCKDNLPVSIYVCVYVRENKCMQA